MFRVKWITRLTSTCLIRVCSLYEYVQTKQGILIAIISYSRQLGSVFNNGLRVFRVGLVYPSSPSGDPLSSHASRSYHRSVCLCDRVCAMPSVRRAGGRWTGSVAAVRIPVRTAAASSAARSADRTCYCTGTAVSPSAPPGNHTGAAADTVPGLGLALECLTFRNHSKILLKHSLR